MGPADYAWDFNAPDGVPGFALQLGGDLQKLLAQAIGEIAASEEPVGTAPEAAPPPALPEPVRLAEAAPPAPVAEALEEPPPAVRARRHGGAVPVVEGGTGDADGPGSLVG
jgi:hypothetical protein